MSAVPTLHRAAAVEPLANPVDAAARRLYESHERLVVSYCLGRLGNREDAEDAAQTTFFYAVRALRRGVVPEAEAAWLLAIARNVCHDRWKADRRRGNLEAVHDPQALEELAPAVERESGDAARLRDALASLPGQQRHAVVLREWHGLSCREIATELGTSQSAVEALLFRARRSLARALDEDGRPVTRVRAFDLASVVACGKTLAGGASAAKLAATAVAASAIAVAAGVAGDVAARGDVERARPTGSRGSEVAAHSAPVRPRAGPALEAGPKRTREARRAGPARADSPPTRAAAPAPGAATPSISEATPDGAITSVTAPLEDALPNPPPLAEVPDDRDVPDATKIVPSTDELPVDVSDVELP